MDVNKLFKDWKKDHALLVSHIGGTDGHPGLVTPADRLAIDFKGNRATGLDRSKKANLSDLPFGFYINKGNNYNDGPAGIDGTLATVEIAGWGTYRYYTFTQIATGKQWVRSIYDTLYDSGWTDNNWVKATLINGFTGTFEVRKTQVPQGELVDMRFNVNGNFPNTNALMEFAQIPDGYTTMRDGNIMFDGLAMSDNKYFAVGLSIKNRATLQAIRLNGDTNSYKSLIGSKVFIRG